MTTPHDILNWSHSVHNRTQDSDLDDAASFAIEQYLSKEDKFPSDASAYSFLNICCKRKYKDEKIKHQHTVSIEDEELITDDALDAERKENINFIRQLIELLPALYKQILVKWLDEEPAQKIAADEGITIDCFYQRRKRAEEKLKQLVLSELKYF